MPRTLRRNPVPVRIRSTRKNPVIDLSEFDASKGFHDVQDAVFRYAPETDFYPDEFDARDQHGLDILAKHGIDAERTPLGKGAMARVYALDGDPDWVVKITSDPTDAALMADAQFAGPFAGTPGIPKVASVFDLGPTPVRPDKFPGPIFAIVVERLNPLAQQDKLKVRALAKTYQRGWLAEPSSVREMLKRVAKGSVEEAWLRGVLFVYAMGFRPTDLHANNIMQRRDGTYVFSDFGVSGVESRAASRDIPTMRNPLSRRNPRRRKNPPRKAKPPTLAEAGLPSVWFHGTQKTFARLKAQGTACIWLADKAGAMAYATPHYGRRSAIRLIEVVLAPDTRVVDLADVNDPAVREFVRLDTSESNIRWHGREEVTDAEMSAALAYWQGRKTHYDAIEARPWAKAFFRKAGADALLVRDVAGWGGHAEMPSLCLLNSKKVTSEQDVAADLTLVRPENLPKRENPRRRKNPDLRASVTANLRPDTVAVVAFWSPKDNNWLRKQFNDMASAQAFFAKAEQAPAARYVPSQFYVVGE
jgi:hypothetical protein